MPEQPSDTDLPVAGPPVAAGGVEPPAGHPEAPGGAVEDRDAPAGGAGPAALDEGAILAPARARPDAGWRRAVYRASGGRVNPGPARAERDRRDQDDRIRRPVPRGHRVAVLSLKGGAGKTTTTLALGATLATVRGDRVLALDANPDRGTLADRVDEQARFTVRDLLDAGEQVASYHDVRRFTSAAGTSRLEVLGSERDPARSRAFDEQDYRRAVTLLDRFYPVLLTDCGTGLLHSAMQGVLDLADSLVIVATPSLDGARSANATLDWLEAHDRRGLARDSVAVVSGVRPKVGAVRVERIEEHFAGRCRAVVRVPYDRWLASGAPIDLDLLSEPTRDAYRRLAALIAERF